MRKKMEADQQGGITKNERLSLILATYQRNLELTERKLAASKQESIDLQVQLNQLMRAGMVMVPSKGMMGPSGLHMNPISEELNPESSAVLGQENSRNQAAMFAALTEQIKELKQQMMSKSTPQPTAAAVAPQSSSSSVVSNESSTSNSKVGVDKPKLAIGKAMSNSYGFETMEECLEYISELEGENGRKALSMQLQAAQERVIELNMRNMSLEEELLSYFQYMKQIVAKHKSELSHLKRPVDGKIVSVSTAGPPIDPTAIAIDQENYVKLPMIKL